MAKNRRVKTSWGVLELNGARLEELMKSEEIQKVLNAVAEDIRDRAGEGYEVGRAEEKVLSTRAIATVYAASPEAKRDNLRNNTLLKAAGSFNGCNVTDE